MENQALNLCKVFATLLLFFFLERPAFLWVQEYLSTFSSCISQRAPKNYAKPRIITVSGSGIYFWFCHWLFEDFCSFFMHKSIFPSFPHLIFYCPLNITKNLHDMHGFLPSQYCYLILRLMYIGVCLLWMVTQALLLSMPDPPLTFLTSFSISCYMSVIELPIAHAMHLTNIHWIN